MKDLQKLKEIFLSDDIDSEDYESNLADIRSWESQLIENKNMLGWQNHDITKEIMKKSQGKLCRIINQVSQVIEN